MADASIAEAPEPTLTIGDRLAEAVAEIERLREFSQIGGGDPLFDYAAEVVALAQRLPAVDGYDRAYERALVRLLGWKRLSTRSGSQTNWDKDDVTGVNACKLLKDMLQELEGLRLEEIGALRTAAFTPALEAVTQIRSRSVGAAQGRRARGISMTFLSGPATCCVATPTRAAGFSAASITCWWTNSRTQTQFRRRIAFLPWPATLMTAQGAPRRTGRTLCRLPASSSWWATPKQSIYRLPTCGHYRDRWRMCATTWCTRARRCSRTFRSQQSIISWVNHVFGRWMRNEVGSELQADYRDLIATHGVAKEGEERAAACGLLRGRGRRRERGTQPVGRKGWRLLP